MTMAHEDNRSPRSLLVGLANPKTAPALMDLAAALARQVDLRVTVTRVLTVPPRAKLDSVRGSQQFAAADKVLAAAIQAGADRGLAVRGAVEVARHAHEGVVRAASSQQADTILVAYSDESPAREKNEKRFDRTMHRVARDTEADLIIAKFRNEERRTLLIPLAVHVNLAVTGLLARAISEAEGAAVRFLHVIPKGGDEGVARERIAGILGGAGIADMGELTVVAGGDPMATTLKQSNAHDLTIIGANPRPTFAESVLGSWADRIAAQSERTILVVRAKPSA